MFNLLVEVLNCCFCFKRKRKLNEEEIGVSGGKKLTRIRFLPNKEFEEFELRRRIIS